MRVTVAAIKGAFGGAVIALLLAIAYDTSSATSALEGGRGHLKFGAIIVYAMIAAIVGGAVAGAIERRALAEDEKRK